MATDPTGGSPSDRAVIDLFAGPGGWSQALRMLGMHDVGLELDEAACQTRAAAGHLTIRTDVAAYPTEPFVGKTWGLIASPPCQDFSQAGKRAGLAGLRGQLVWQVLRWVDEVRPGWVACEQVPEVEPIWQHIAHTMRGWGYKPWVGILNAADYGVPQTRRRAFLLARLDGPVMPPEPTHAKGGSPGDLFGGQRRPWVSMAQALGWRDQLVVNTRGDRTTPGGNEFAADKPSWALTEKTRSWFVSAGVTGEGRPKDPHRHPADTLTGKGTAYWSLRHDDQAKATVRPIDQPAATLISGTYPQAMQWESDAGDKIRVTVEEAGVLQSFPADYPWRGSRTKQFQQVGNAVPPLLAAHVLSSVTGIALPEAVCDAVA